MKIALCVHGFPPELMGGTELAAAALARSLARAGDDVIVVTGSLRGRGGLQREDAVEETEAGGERVRVVRLLRGDLYFDHWQKSGHPLVTRIFRELLRAERVELVHVHHWLRLSDELVLAAARERVPALVSLHDHFVDCLLGARVDPRTARPCERGASAGACVPCAAHVPPRTPWLPIDQQWLYFEKRKQRLLRELCLARARIVPTLTHAQSIAQFLPEAAALEYEVIPPARDASMQPRAPLPAPRALGTLRLGTWGHSSAIKGLELVREAVRRASAGARVELRSAGALGGAPYAPHELAAHAVSDVHALVCGSLAPESYGIVLDEARELGLVALLPREGAFVERAREGEGVLFYACGDVQSLASVIARLANEDGLLESLRERIPAAATSLDDVVSRTRELYARVVAQGPPDPAGLPKEEWFATRLAEAEMAHWDEALSRASPRELGFAETGRSRRDELA